MKLLPILTLSVFFTAGAFSGTIEENILHNAQNDFLLMLEQLPQDTLSQFTNILTIQDKAKLRITSKNFDQRLNMYNWGMETDLADVLKRSATNKELINSYWGKLTIDGTKIPLDSIILALKGKGNIHYSDNYLDAKINYKDELEISFKRQETVVGKEKLFKLVKLLVNYQKLELLEMDDESQLIHALMSKKKLLSLMLNRLGIVDAASAKDFADFLEVNPFLTKLNLGGNKIGDDGAMSIAEALKNNTSLTELILASNGISNFGAYKIAEALEVNTSLKLLSIGLNSFDQEGVEVMVRALEKNISLNRFAIPTIKTSDMSMCRLEGVGFVEYGVGDWRRKITSLTKN